MCVNILHNLNMFTGWQEQKESKVLLCSAGDTHPTRTLNELAEGTDMLIQQIMGPLPAFDTLSFESQYLLNVSQRIPPALNCLLVSQPLSGSVTGRTLC